MATDFDPYRILELDASAGQAEIDAAYRRMWAASPSDPSSEARLRELQAAYRILSDPVERRAYDERRAMAPGAAPAAVAEPPSPEPPVARDVPLWTIQDIARAVVTVLVIVLVGSIPIVLAAAEIAGGTDQIEDDPNALAVTLAASALFQFSTLGAAWWFGVRKYGLSLRSLGWRLPERGGAWLGFGLMIGAMVIVVVYGLALSAAGIEPDTDLPDAVYDNALPLTIALILTVGVAPFVEETFFRGFVFGGMARRYGWVVAAIGSSVLWSLAHIANSGYLYVLPPIIGIGILFAWGYRYSRSIYPTMMAHFLFNVVQMVGVLATR
jgi:membrane protease YdiL (CAAX protease family)